MHRFAYSLVYTPFSVSSYLLPANKYILCKLHKNCRSSTKPINITNSLYFPIFFLYIFMSWLLPTKIIYDAQINSKSFPFPFCYTCSDFTKKHFNNLSKSDFFNFTSRFFIHFNPSACTAISHSHPASFYCKIKRCSSLCQCNKFFRILIPINIFLLFSYWVCFSRGNVRFPVNATIQ